jgi:hypothetical protein
MSEKKELPRPCLSSDAAALGAPRAAASPPSGGWASAASGAALAAVPGPEAGCHG